MLKVTHVDNDHNFLGKFIVWTWGWASKYWNFTKSYMGHTRTVQAADKLKVASWHGSNSKQRNFLECITYISMTREHRHWNYSLLETNSNLRQTRCERTSSFAYNEKNVMVSQILDLMPWSEYRRTKKTLQKKSKLLPENTTSRTLDPITLCPILISIICIWNTHQPNRTWQWLHQLLCKNF